MAETIELVPESIRTEVLQSENPSRIGLPRRMIVTVGDNYGLDERYVLLGSVRQVDLWTSGNGEGPDETDYTIEDLLRNSSTFGTDEMIAKFYPRQRTVKELSGRFLEQDRNRLFEGPFARPTKPGELSTLFEGVVGIWIPRAAVLESNWSVLQENGSDKYSRFKNDDPRERIYGLLN